MIKHWGKVQQSVGWSFETLVGESEENLDWEVLAKHELMIASIEYVDNDKQG